MKFRQIKQEKIDAVTGIENVLNTGKGLVIFENKGINGYEINELRNKLRKDNIKIVIIKNKLISIALKNVVKDFNLDIKNNTVVFIADNAIDALGSVKSFDSNESKLLFPMIMVDQKAYINNEQKIKSLSKIKNQQELYASLVMVLKLPIIKLVKLLDIISNR